MYDRWEQSVPKNTAEADAIKVQCKVSPGVLTSLLIFAPSGCKGLLRCRVSLGEKPIAPRSGKSFLSGEGFIAEIRNAWEPIRADLPVLNWFLWNVDTAYAHKPWMSAEWIAEDEPYELLTYRSVKDLSETIKRMLRV